MSRQFALWTSVAGAVAACSTTEAAGYRPKTGQPHPDFALPSVRDQAPIRLSAFRGKKLLLLHLASW